MISSSDAAALAGAGVLAGIVGTAGGITSLISYPALLAVGLPALPATFVNTVGLVTFLPGSALTSRPELAGRGAWLRRWAPLAAAGGVAGAALLLSTPEGVFAQIVPWLLAFGSLGLIAQRRLSGWLGRLPRRGQALLLPCGLFAITTYNGYFGAGAGILTLTLLVLTVDRHATRANALKNMLVGVATVASAAALALFGSVDWAAAGPLALGMLVGSAIGPVVARRLPAGVLRWFAALTGLGLAVRLLISPA